MFTANLRETQWAHMTRLFCFLHKSFTWTFQKLSSHRWYVMWVWSSRVAETVWGHCASWLSQVLSITLVAKLYRRRLSSKPKLRLPWKMRPCSLHRGVFTRKCINEWSPHRTKMIKILIYNVFCILKWVWLSYIHSYTAIHQPDSVQGKTDCRRLRWTLTVCLEDYLPPG